MKLKIATLLLALGFTALWATDELLIQDTKLGLGREALPRTSVTVHYTGKLTNGKVFDSSVDRGEPFQFDLGAGQVIQGWEKGIVGMKEGGKRKLTIPPHMGYGSRAVGPIPANSTLIFDVELIRVK
jgi:FKBP-type peptidyl-prolyl cis-trans isomerase